MTTVPRRQRSQPKQKKKKKTKASSWGVAAIACCLWMVLLWTIVSPNNKPLENAAAATTIIDQDPASWSNVPQPPPNRDHDQRKHTNTGDNDDPDQDCPFRHSALYRSIFVYPNPHTEATLFAHVRSSSNTTTTRTTIEWPWMVTLHQTRSAGTGLYDIIDNPSVTQFALDAVVYELLTSPHSCLRTEDPSHAQLFFVPFLPSLYRRGGRVGRNDTRNGDNNHGPPPPQPPPQPPEHTSVYEEALAHAMMGTSYDGWEQTFGLTSRYWRARNGTDHVVVMPEPLHGLYHPRGKRGFHHYIKTQKQLTASIVISVELSRTFVETYPRCSRQKNLVVPYPNVDGRWYNGVWDEQARLVRHHQRADDTNEQSSSLNNDRHRPFSVYYAAGNHGECRGLRRALHTNHQCENHHPFESQEWHFHRTIGSFPVGMRRATFCPCPGGDSPSAKRMYDAVLAGCIPVILSHDFVWPFSTTTTMLPSSTSTSSSTSVLNPEDFAIHVDAQAFTRSLYNKTRATNGSFVCQRTADPSIESLQAYLLRTVSPNQVARLQKGLQRAATAFSYFSFDHQGETTKLPNNPLQHGILPAGGAAHRLVEELADRAQHGAAYWEQCQQEKTDVLRRTGGKMVTSNKC